MGIQFEDNSRFNELSANSAANQIFCDACCLCCCRANEIEYFITRDSIYAKRAYAIAIPSVCLPVRLSVCPSVTRVDQSKTVEVRIMQFSPHSSPVPLVFAR